MAHLQYMPGDPRLVDQLVYELKSKGIFDQFRKDCISDVDTRPAYQNLRQRVESSVALFLSRQTWKPDLNKNQLREKLRKHILDGNYLEQGVERIVDQVVNPKVASVFIPQVEDLVYNYLGIARKKSTPETSNDKGNSSTDLLPTDLEAVSPGSVKSDDKDEQMEESKDEIMEVDEDKLKEININDISMPSDIEPEKEADTQLSGISDLTSHGSEASIDKLSIPMPAEEINLENIPSPENSPPKIDLDSIELPKEEPESIELKDIPLPDESPKEEKDQYFKPINSEDDSSSESSIIRNMSPLTPIRNFNNENSCDAQQAFDNDSDNKNDDKKEPNTFRFTIDAKSPENSSDVKDIKPEKEEQTNLAYQFNEQVNINTFNTPLYDDSSNSHNLQIDYESDANSKTNLDKIPFPDDPTSEDSKKESTDEKRSHKSSHRSRDSHRHSSSSKDKRTDSKHSSSKDRKDSKQDRKSSKDDQSKSKSSSDRSKDKDRKESKDKDKHRSSHKSSSSKDSKHRSSSSSQRHSSKHDDKDRKSGSSSSKDKERTDKSSKDHKSSRDSKSSRSDKDKDKKKRDDKDKDKKDNKDDDHYSASGRGNHTRRSTDRDSNDGSSSSKGSHNPSSSKFSESKTNKGSSSKSDNTSPSSNYTSPSDKENILKAANTEANVNQPKPVRVDTRLEMPMASPPRLPFVPDVTLKKPRFAANLEEAKRLMKMRRFLDEEQKRMNQEAALLLEFQANVRPSLSQVYSSVSGPELEFACISNTSESQKPIIETNYAEVKTIEEIEYAPGSIEMQLSEMNKETKKKKTCEIKEETKKEDEIKEEVETAEADEIKIVTIAEADETEEVVKTEEDESEDVIKTEEVVETEEVFEPIELNQPNFEDTEKILNEISKKVYGIVDDEDEDSVNDIYRPVLKKEEEITEGIKNEHTEFEVTVITEEITDNDTVEDIPDNELRLVIEQENVEDRFEYFAEHEKYNAELERDKFERFLKTYTADLGSNKLYLINCDAYEESIIKEVAQTHGDFEIINYHKNGHMNKNIVKNVNVSNEIVLPIDKNNSLVTLRSPIFSPIKSECSFELSSDYDAKLEEMVNKASRQQIMEIILGGAEPDESKLEIDYIAEENIEKQDDLKRKLSVESSDNNNGHVLKPKLRKISESDQISSTTEETPDPLNVSRTKNVRSKYLGKARRVGLPRPKKNVHPNSPSSDKSVENYDTNDRSPDTKLKRTPHVRYDTSDLYKPKLHYLSRRNSITQAT
ncbi:biorientation of chromosomes in cell division protein 1-like 1 [Leguminivora glycinivorella]|uniref:biorientation of chromosomes in cell division protein 1-like 1 n=1 Tax=Leguminivora glycinivorella TaxID=1035111 RepID=UPI00200BD99A|nr:biorientation of chromosomes in cell division protein 1-like 1 [Leguminivora glycinivorella]